ncbi:MAG: hypothetical protein R6W06_01590 [Prochlorococcaceae cyanobacterium]
MAATRLNDSQKQELLARYRNGEASQLLAEAFGCSANTVSRIVKAALDPSEYEALKQQRSRPPARRAVAAAVAGAAPLSAAPLAAPQAPSSDGEDGDDDHRLLAIDDADDFAEAGEDDDIELDGELDLGAEEGQEFVVVPLALGELQHQPLACRPFSAAGLPASLYMLVDKTVELQARPLREFAELGPLPEEEEERQALMLFTNPRQAKRFCGRSQRVIKMPDPAVLERTAPYLLAQGISRLVLEGALYSLPGS